MKNDTIVVKNFWPGYLERTDINNIEFIKKLFSYSKCLSGKNFSPNTADGNILLEGHCYWNNFVDLSHISWKYKIHMSIEPNSAPLENYDVVLYSMLWHHNVVLMPYFVVYMNMVNIRPLRSFKPRYSIPPKFCCFIVSNPCNWVRNTMFDRLNEYKRVDSWGKHKNNCDGRRIMHEYYTQEYIDTISQYKFIICFENNKVCHYATEKIVNPYLARIVPIYWGSHDTLKVWNRDSMVFLEDETEEAFQRVIDRVKYLDANDDEYLKVLNTHPISWDVYEENYSLSVLGKKIDEKLGE